MFRSKKRPLIISQYEHSRLAGFLAQNWGNDQFDRPTLDFPSFVQGVALHDWHYGLTDNWSISGLEEETWLRIARLGLKTILDDPISDIVSKMHLHRLVSYGPPSDARKKLSAAIASQIARRLPQTGHQMRAFYWADKITRFCDFVVFHFAFEEPIKRTLTICRRKGSDQQTEITYQISDNGIVTIHPWPFVLPRLGSILTAFQEAGYPQELKPQTIPFSARPAPST